MRGFMDLHICVKIWRLWNEYVTKNSNVCTKFGNTYINIHKRRAEIARKFYETTSSLEYVKHFVKVVQVMKMVTKIFIC